jgi:uncharacterized protein (DUF488 family)
MSSQSPTSPAVLTTGHSTRSEEEFIDLLRAHDVTLLMDVRTVPRSRRNPQFNREALAQSLTHAGIRYEHEPALGGFRKPRPDSPNAGWRNLSFRGYADYMQTDAFAHALDEVIETAQSERVALMCAEAVPWRCHRSLIADALVVHGVPAFEIAGRERLEPHRLTSFAKVDGTRITYPPAGVSEALDL